MLDFTKSKGDCTGCGACLSSCPVQCITMVRDEEGFIYPSATDTCIHCGKCERVCPLVHLPRPENLVDEKQAFCALSRSRSVWRRSASGGAFSEICRAFGDEDTLIVGAVWDGLTVVHRGVNGVSKIAPLCKSKYVFSDMQGTLPQIAARLKEGGKVIFCGTPCQVAAVRNYLGKPQDNLLLIDLICHGAGSPLVFTECLKALGRQLKGKVTHYEFRAKRQTFETDHLAAVTVAEHKIYLREDPYMQIFLQQNCLRPSCGKNCHFRDENRQGDITIADFKGLVKVFPQLTGTKYNYSSVIFNNDKGRQLIAPLSKGMTLLPCRLDDIREYNPLYFRQTCFSADRDRFFQDFCKDPQTAIQNWTKPAYISKRHLINHLFGLAPNRLRRVVIRIAGRRHRRQGNP